jgi:hypothetical protein
MHETSLKKLLIFLSPTRTETILFAFAGIMLILAAKTANFFNGLTSRIGAEEEIKRVWGSFSDRMAEYSDISGALLWFLAGAALYLIVWLIVVIAIDWYNDILVSTSFVHPKSFHQSEYWVAIAGRFMIRVAAAVIFLVLMAIIFGTFIEYGYEVASEAWKNDILTMIGSFSLIVLMSFAVLYSATLLLRLVFLRRRLYE